MGPKAHLPLKDANFRNPITSPQSCSPNNPKPLTTFTRWLPSTIVIKDAIIKLRNGKTKDWLPAGAKLQRGPSLSLLFLLLATSLQKPSLVLSFLNLIPNLLYNFPIFLQTYTPSLSPQPVFHEKPRTFHSSAPATGATHHDSSDITPKQACACL